MKAFLFYLFILTSWVVKSQCDTLIPVERNNKWGYVNSNGDTLIDPIYTWVGVFSEGIARVYLGGTIQSDMGPTPIEGNYGYIDTTGRPITPFKYRWADDFQNGYAQVVSDAKKAHLYNFINTKGREVVPRGYQVVTDKPFGQEPRPDMAYIIDYDRITYYQRIATSSDYHKEMMEKVSDCPECIGVLRTRKKAAYGLIDTSGQILIEPRFTGIRFVPNTDRMIGGVQDGLYHFLGMYSLRGEEVVPPEFISISSFNKGFAIATHKNGLSGVMDSTGQLVIPCEYENIRPTKEGFDCQRFRDRRLVNRTDTLIIMNWGMDKMTGKYVYKTSYYENTMRSSAKTIHYSWHQLKEKQK